jgi:hypothetical protein
MPLPSRKHPVHAQPSGTGKARPAYHAQE